MSSVEEGGIAATPLPRRAKPRRLSDLFAQIAREARGDVSVGDIRDMLGDRSFAALLVIFGAINMIPLPPGVSTFLGMPLLIVSAQMIYGNRRAWLPQLLARRSLTVEQFRGLMDRVVPRLTKLERLIRPRFWPFWRKQEDRVIGVIALLMAIAIVLPIPLGNWLPAFSTTLLGLALTERDGIFFGAGLAVGAAAIGVIAFVIGAGAAATHYLYGWMF